MEKLAKHPEYAKMAEQLRREGKGYREISNELQQKGMEVSHMGVKTYLDKVETVGAQMIREDDTLKAQAKEEILNTTEQIRKINFESWELISFLKNKLDDEKSGLYSASLLINALDKLVRQVELSNKLMGRFLNAQTVNISYLDYSTNITAHLKLLEQKGIVKILKPGEL